VFAPVYLKTVDTHAEGMPLRVVVEGLPFIPGHSMVEKLEWARANLEWVRELLVSEPRGHGPMMYAILTEPTRPEADCGVIYMSGGGFWPMCGHGTIGVVTMLVERGLVGRREPETAVTLDTAVGLIETRVRVEGGKAIEVAFRNVPSFVLVGDTHVHLPAFGDIAVSVAYGGNLYTMIEVEQLQLQLELPNLNRFIELGLALVEATRNQVPIEHPAGADLGQLRSALFIQAASPTRLARNLMVKEPRYADRSPCGTGTSVRMAQAHSRGQIGLNEPMVCESIIGSRFEGRLLATTTVHGMPAVVPQIAGRAWIVGSAEFTVDPTDIFPRGFSFS
jgi:proline racemase